MSKILKLSLILLPAALVIFGCSAAPKEDQSGNIVKNKDFEAVSDTSAPLPSDSADVQSELQEKAADSLRHLQTRIPVDRQIKEDTSDYPQTEAPVEVPQKEVKPRGNFAVQLGAFSSDKNATDFALKAERKLGETPTVKFNPDNGLFVVQYGNFETRIETEHAVKELKKKNFKDAFLVKLK
ncbi:MAG TPA: SPOR domain-containing protein [Ignavibacteriales bacterium]|nr:SPOR domain-containing protein [Ignavibacteriales bacterium]